MKILFDPMLLLLATAKDVLPVLGLLVLFQTLVLKRPIPRPGRIIFGFGLVLVGMACFLSDVLLEYYRFTHYKNASDFVRGLIKYFRRDL